MKNSIFNFCTLFGIGQIPKYQGSFASLFVGLLWYAFILLLKPSFILQISIVSIFILLSILSINEYMKTSAKDDPEEVVVDEACGIMIALLFMNLNTPSVDYYSSFIYFIFALLIFRVLDALKPSIIYRIQLLNTPSSILMDDVLAGILSLILTVCLRINAII